MDLQPESSPVALFIWIKQWISYYDLKTYHDSGYGQHFTDIGNVYDIDIAMIGIGAYEPQWFMHTAHTGPAEAVKAFEDLRAKQWIPMHYGTFDLSDEPIFYPEQILREQHADAIDQILWMDIGKSIAF